MVASRTSARAARRLLVDEQEAARRSGRGARPGRAARRRQRPALPGDAAGSRSIRRPDGSSTPRCATSAICPTRAVPAYTGLDVRIGWQPHKQLELSVGGLNLLDRRHPEFGTAADAQRNPALVLREGAMDLLSRRAFALATLALACGACRCARAAQAAASRRLARIRSEGCVRLQVRRVRRLAGAGLQRARQRRSRSPCSVPTPIAEVLEQLGKAAPHQRPAGARAARCSAPIRSRPRRSCSSAPPRANGCDRSPTA